MLVYPKEPGQETKNAAPRGEGNFLALYPRYKKNGMANKRSTRDSIRFPQSAVNRGPDLPGAERVQELLRKPRSERSARESN